MAAAVQRRRRRMGFGERIDWLMSEYHRQISESHARQAEQERARMDEIDRAMAELEEVAR